MVQLPVFAVSVFLYAGCTAVVSTGPKSCDQNVLAGSQTFRLPTDAQLADLKTFDLPTGSMLTWKRNAAVIYRSGGKDDTGNLYKVDQRGTLLLPAQALVEVGQKDVYQREVHDDNGINQNIWSTTLCVLDKVPTPTLEFTCQDSEVLFNCNCNVSKTQDLQFGWKVNNVRHEWKNTTFRRPMGNRESVMCTVFNKVDAQHSQTVTDYCIALTSPWLVLEWYMIYILAGGGLVLLLLIILTIICCVQFQRRKRKRHRDDSELRLAWSNQTPQQNQQQKQQQKKKRPPVGPQSHRCKPSGDPHRPRPKDTTSASTGSAANPARPRPRPRPGPGPQQQERGPVEVVGVDHGPPLPKPRKKAPRASTRGPQ